jgi:hypothetical protein
MRIIVLLAGVMAMANVALAGVYEWTDSQGGVHFTDNADKIPPKFRNSAREMDLQPVIQTEEGPAAAIAPTMERSPSAYGGHDETWWRTNYRTLRDEMKSIQDRLPGKRDRLTELRRKKAIYSKPGGRIAYYDMLKEIEGDEARVTGLQKQIADLDTNAEKAGVPLGWRQ